MPLDYSLLLRLDHGPAAVVENLKPTEVQALRVQTPVTRFLEALPRAEAPRHVFLTGNAGDGKTFAVTSARVDDGRAFEGFCVITDAAALHKEREDPIETLASEMSAALSRGERLLIAINRGQLERLHRHVGAEPERGELGSLVAAAVRQLPLRVHPKDDDTARVLVLDLGLVDTLAPEIVDPLLDRLASVAPDPAMSPNARDAFSSAQRELGGSMVRGELRRALDTLRGTSLHVTMRQLWSFGAYLLTGWRPIDCTKPLTIEDSVAARMYSEEAGLALVDALRERCDPALTPRPQAAALALSGQLAARLHEREELRPLVSEGDSVGGPASLRVAAAYQVATDEAPASPLSAYQQAVSVLLQQEAGWVGREGITAKLLKGIFDALELPLHGGQLPRWQQLCYDTRRLSGATMIAAEVLEPAEYRLALPRPTPRAQDALEGVWSPPYVVIAPPQEQGRRGRLRLEPDLFCRLYSGASADTSPLSPASAEVLRRWLSQASLGSRSLKDQLWLASRRHDTNVEVLGPDAFTRRLSFAKP